MRSNLHQDDNEETSSTTRIVLAALGMGMIFLLLVGGTFMFRVVAIQDTQGIENIVSHEAGYQEKGVAPEALETSIENQGIRQNEPLQHFYNITTKIELDAFMDTVPKRIFFLHFSNSGRRRFTNRALCAIESAAITNPDHAVILFELSDPWINSGGANPDDIETQDHIFNMDNVKHSYLLVSAAVNGSLHEDFYNINITNAKQRRQHMSDWLRASLIYEYGGLYSDTDAIFFKSVNNLTNTIGFENQKRADEPGKGKQVINNAVISFEPKHPWMKRYLDNIAGGVPYKSTGRIWVGNVVSTVTAGECTDDATLDYCQNVHFADYKLFYLTGWGGGHGHYFHDVTEDKGYIENKLAIHDRDTYISHLWGSFMGREDVKITDDIFLGHVMKRQCPYLYGHQ